MGELRFMQGNAAMTEGAIAAGARFFAGYPITPSTEVAEMSAVRLPQVGGMYVQMEDELGSIAALIGASCAGRKAYTATSGPGFTLMQENLGVAVMGEIPCVLIDVQRCGPSTGLATKPAQGDVMQARYGTHGDHGIIALTPSSVQECFDLMVTAFNFSELYRTPVIFLSDEIIGHLKEQVIIRSGDELNVVGRAKPTCSPEEYRPYDFDSDFTPLAEYGSEYVFKINASTHDETGRPSADPGNCDRLVRHLSGKIERNRDKIAITKKYMLEDAEYVIIAYGGAARSALSAMEKARERGIRAGVLRLVTLWPVPEREIAGVMKNAKAVIVPELNLGQYIGEIRMRNPGNIPVVGVNRTDSRPILPDEILDAIEEVSV
ncbi:MAG: 2-oxoacid:acceptor oxidoreductase subunit alpha [Anaerovoracaceae bacterium]